MVLGSSSSCFLLFDWLLGIGAPRWLFLLDHRLVSGTDDHDHDDDDDGRICKQAWDR